MGKGSAQQNPNPEEEKVSNTPRIYVACLASYNRGNLHGAWIDADRGAWAIWDGIKAMLARSPVSGAEEYAIHDYEGFGAVRLAEYACVETVAETADFLMKHGEVGAELLAYYGGDLAEARDAISDHYCGCHASLADYVQELTEDVVEIPETLKFYIDWEAMARDAEMSGDLFAIEIGYGQVHVFATQ